MISTNYRSIGIIVFVALSIPGFAAEIFPDPPESPVVQFCGLGERYLNPKGVLCLRIKGGQLFWHAKLIRAEEHADYVRGALKATNLKVVAIFPSPAEKFGDVFRSASLLGTLPVEKVFVTPPVSDSVFEAKTKDVR